MRVLLPAVDIFYSVGGGQSFYKQLIKANPDIEFSYLIRNESEKENRIFSCITAVALKPMLSCVGKTNEIT